VPVRCDPFASGFDCKACEVRIGDKVAFYSAFHIMHHIKSPSGNVPASHLNRRTPESPSPSDGHQNGPGQAGSVSKLRPSGNKRDDRRRFLPALLINFLRFAAKEAVLPSIRGKRERKTVGPCVPLNLE